MSQAPYGAAVGAISGSYIGALAAIAKRMAYSDPAPATLMELASDPLISGGALVGSVVGAPIGAWAYGTLPKKDIDTAEDDSANSVDRQNLPFKSAATQNTEEEQTKKKKYRLPGLVSGTTGLGALSLGAAYGIASDDQVSRVHKAIKDYDPDVFLHNKPPENYTGLTYYQKTLSPGAQLKPFNVPVGELLVKLRSNRRLMRSLGTESYLLADKDTRFGGSGLAHYDMFSRGPVPAYMHQLKARLSNLDVPESFGVPAGTKYSDWMGRKFEDFIASKTGQRINPFEFTTKFRNNEQQQALMEDFFKSLPENQQKFRIEAENPGSGYAAQTRNYLPVAMHLVDFRDKLKQTGLTALGAGAGGALGHFMMRKHREKKPLAYWASVLGGSGLGGLASYYASSDSGKEQINKLLSQIMTKRSDMSQSLSFNSKNRSSYIKTLADTEAAKTAMLAFNFIKKVD